MISMQIGGKAAYHLMIPTTWQFKGWVNSGVMKGQGVMEGGCFADFFEVFGEGNKERRQRN